MVRTFFELEEALEHGDRVLGLGKEFNVLAGERPNLQLELGRCGPGCLGKVAVEVQRADQLLVLVDVAHGAPKVDRLCRLKVVVRSAAPAPAAPASVALALVRARAARKRRALLGLAGQVHHVPHRRVPVAVASAASFVVAVALAIGRSGGAEFGLGLRLRLDLGFRFALRGHCLITESTIDTSPLGATTV